MFERSQSLGEQTQRGAQLGRFVVSQRLQDIHPCLLGIQPALQNLATFGGERKALAAPVLRMFNAQRKPLLHELVKRLADRGVGHTEMAANHRNVTPALLLVRVNLTQGKHLRHRKAVFFGIEPEAAHGEMHQAAGSKSQHLFQFFVDHRNRSAL